MFRAFDRGARQRPGLHCASAALRRDGVQVQRGFA
jgi:hypothetical protein